MFGRNSGFEKLRQGWEIHGPAVIARSSINSPAHSGKYFLAAGDRAHPTKSTLTRHKVLIPNSKKAKLRFFLLMHANTLRKSVGVVTVRINGTLVFLRNATFANNSYIHWTAPVAKWRGKHVKLVVTIMGHNKGRERFFAFLDDFTLTRR